MLVVIIAIEKYECSEIDDLPGTVQDKQKLIELFRDQYKYKVLSNDGNTLNEEGMRSLLDEAREEFMDNKYDGIIVCFSGHGHLNYVLCSDCTEQHDNGVFDRTELEQYFNGIECPDQIGLPKLL